MQHVDFVVGEGPLHRPVRHAVAVGLLTSLRMREGIDCCNKTEQHSSGVKSKIAAPLEIRVNGKFEWQDNEGLYSA